jgi:putative tryptophan/tyrosine transport system substrate-binding protein
MMKRREFITLLGGAAAACPLAARAQQARLRRLSVLMGWTEAEPEFRSWLGGFFAELARLGWAEGRNLEVDRRWTNYDSDRARTHAKELVELRPDAILVGTTPAASALHRETSTIPIVFAGVADPVGAGFIAELPRPGGNMTGFINIESPFGGKWLEMIKEIAPHIRRAAAMYNPETAPYRYFEGAFMAAARSMKVEPVMAAVHSDADIEAAIASLGQERAGLVIFTDSFMGGHIATAIAATTRYKVPAIFDVPFFPRNGGLMSYGASFADLFRHAATYVDRILKGEKPADLPVQVPTRYELVLNVKTAKAIGLEVPASFLVRADEVIE